MSNSDDRLLLLPQTKSHILLQFPLSPFHLPPITNHEFKEEADAEEFDRDKIVLQLNPDDRIPEDQSAQSCLEESTRRVSLGESKNPDDDGFKTPDSSDRRIPEVKQCPPAPRKPRPIKRKAPQARRSLRLDLSGELESLFPTVDFDRTIKKSRMENLNSGN